MGDVDCAHSGASYWRNTAIVHRVRVGTGRSHSPTYLPDSVSHVAKAQGWVWLRWGLGGLAVQRTIDLISEAISAQPCAMATNGGER